MFLQSIRTWTRTETIDDAYALAAAVNSIVTASPGARFYDATFPDHELHFFNDCRIATTSRLAGASAEFFDAFHEPRSMRPIRALPVGLSDIGAASGAPVWVYIGEVTSAVDTCSLFADTNSRLLFRSSPEQETLLSRLPLARYCLVKFHLRGVRANAVYGLIPLSAQQSDPLANAAVTRRQLGYLKLGHTPGSSGVAVPFIACDSRSIPRRSVITLSARQLVNDSKYRCKLDGPDSGLRTGQERLFRICLGRLPTAVKAIAVRFAPSSSHESLGQNLRFQINGTPVDHASQPDGQGSVYNIPLSGRSNSGAVLGVACRRRATVDARIRAVDLIV
jgi:hypothetical protein